MTYRTTFIASLSVVALVLAASETFADPGGARGAGAGVAPTRPAFPSFPRSMHHHHRGGFFPAGGLFYGVPSDVVDEPVVVAPPLKQSDDLRYTCVYDIPWDYVHRCPQFR
jgi:hypothetical protein